MYQFLLLLLEDLSVNPGPVQISPAVNVNIWEPLNKKDFHFLHININSLLPKTDELKCIKLPGYDILRCDRNRNGGGVACYIREQLCFNAKPLNCKEIHTYFC